MPDRRRRNHSLALDSSTSTGTRVGRNALFAVQVNMGL